MGSVNHTCLLYTSIPNNTVARTQYQKSPDNTSCHWGVDVLSIYSCSEWLLDAYKQLVFKQIVWSRQLHTYHYDCKTHLTVTFSVFALTVSPLCSVTTDTSCSLPPADTSFFLNNTTSTCTHTKSEFFLILMNMDTLINHASESLSGQGMRNILEKKNPQDDNCKRCPDKFSNFL